MNIKNNKGIFNGLLLVMIFGAASLKADDESSFTAALTKWSYDKRVSKEDAKSARFFVAMPFADLVEMFKNITFTTLKKAQAFAKLMKNYNLSEVQKTQLLLANESYKNLINNQ